MKQSIHERTRSITAGLVGLALAVGAGASATPAFAATSSLSDDKTFNAALGTGFPADVYGVVALPGEGYLVAAGSSETLNGTTIPKGVVALNADGSLDTAFNANLGTGIGSQAGAPTMSIMKPSSGGFLVGGTQFTEWNGDAASPDRIVRLNDDGTPDTAFNANLGTGFADGKVTVLEETSDGKFIVGGGTTSLNGAPIGHITRLNADGTLDAAYNAAMGTGFNGTVNSVASLADGSLVAVGSFTSYNGTPIPGKIAKIDANGALDTAFNAALGTGVSMFSINKVVQAGDGGFFIGGLFSAFNGDSSVPNSLLKLTATGAVDTAFNAGLGTGFNRNVFNIILDSSGNLDYVVGNFTAFNEDDSVPNGIAKMNADGTVDATFNTQLGTGFREDTEDFAANDQVRGLSIGANGSLLVYGYLNQANEHPIAHKNMMRFTPLTIALPTLTNRSSEVSKAVSVSAAATTTPNQPVTYTATGLPAGVSINASTGAITGKPTTAGSNNVQITASADTFTGTITDTASFTWTITATGNPPTPPVACAKPRTNPVFTDVPRSQRFYNEIDWMHCTKLTTGYADGTFRPSGSVTREAMAAYMFRLEAPKNYTPKTKNPFTDVNTSHKFYKEIAWMKESGLSTGYADGSFRPSAEITREAIAAFIFRMDAKKGYKPTNAQPFADVTKGARFYKEIEWMRSQGLSRGFSDGTFRPQANLSREAMAAFVFRLVNDYRA